MERIQLKTSDNIIIVGNHYRAPQGSPGVLLLHMMPAAKESWDEFAKKLNSAGFGALAIDFRGHGGSEGGPKGYRDFSDAQHQASIEDARAGILFQKNEGHQPLFAVGASIGSNFALQILSEDERVRAAVLLSPGINYRGVETLPFAKTIRSNQGVYMAASKDDTSRAGLPADGMAEDIFGALSTQDKKIEVFEAGGHGTDLFVSHPDLQDRIISWMKAKA